MNPDTKRRVELVIDEAVALAAAGADPWEAARAALVAQQTDVYKELAIAAIVDTVERRARVEALAIERAAERAVGDAPKFVPSPEQVARRRAEDERREIEAMERSVALAQKVNKMMDDYVEGLRVEWTRDLLETVVALGDGTRVKWGDATLDQHARRAEMLERNAGANFEAASRHRIAIRELEASGATTLRDMVSAEVSR